MTATQAGPPAMDPEDSGPGGADSDTASADTARLATASIAVPSVASTAERIAALRARLMSPMPDDRLWGWIGPLLVTAFAAFFRFNRLVIPRALIFDETYYAKDAWSILQHGVEWNLVQNANQLIIAGHTNIFQACSGTACGEYVVHPPVGKLLIAVGEWFYGLNSVGWRVSSAFFGSLAILIMCRVARRLTRSTLLGCVAGLLLSLDGLEFVLSRTGILDIFLMFFVLAAFGCLVVDRDVSRARMAEVIVLRPGDEAGPRLGIRKWRVAAGLLIGLACATKQDAIWYVFAFAGLALAWDIGARRAAGLRDYLRGALVRDGKWLPVTFGVIPLVTYVASWSGWLITGTGYGRDYAQQHGVTTPVISALYSLFEYHKQMLQFDVTLNKTHPYMSQPWGWMVHQPPGRVLLPVLHGPLELSRLPGRIHRASVVPGSARDREPRHLVGGYSRDDLLPRLVAYPQGLAGGRGGAWRRRRMGDVDAVRLADQVQLLRARVRAVHDLVYRALPGPDHRPGDREPATPRDRLGTGWHLCPCRDRFVLVFLPDPCGEDHSVLLVAVPHVVPRLDLARHDEAPRSQSGLIASFQLARNVATYLKVI